MRKALRAASRRVWCIYETYISTLEQSGAGRRYLFDIYTNENEEKNEAVGITDGLCAADGTGSKQARRKRHREWRFPFDLIQKALATQLFSAFYGLLLAPKPFAQLLKAF